MTLNVGESRSELGDAQAALGPGPLLFFSDAISDESLGWTICLLLHRVQVAALGGGLRASPVRDCGTGPPGSPPLPDEDRPGAVDCGAGRTRPGREVMPRVVGVARCARKARTTKSVWKSRRKSEDADGQPGSLPAQEPRISADLLAHFLLVFSPPLSLQRADHMRCAIFVLSCFLN